MFYDGTIGELCDSVDSMLMGLARFGDPCRDDGRIYYAEMRRIDAENPADADAQRQRAELDRDRKRAIDSLSGALATVKAAAESNTGELRDELRALHSAIENARKPLEDWLLALIASTISLGSASANDKREKELAEWGRNASAAIQSVLPVSKRIREWHGSKKPSSSGKWPISGEMLSKVLDSSMEILRSQSSRFSTRVKAGINALMCIGNKSLPGKSQTPNSCESEEVLGIWRLMSEPMDRLAEVAELNQIDSTPLRDLFGACDYSDLDRLEAFVDRLAVLESLGAGVSPNLKASPVQRAQTLAAADRLHDAHHAFLQFKQEADNLKVDLASVKKHATKAVVAIDAAIESMPSVDATLQEVGGLARKAIEIEAKAKPALVKLRAIAEVGSIAMPADKTMDVVWHAQFDLRTGVFVSVNAESEPDRELSKRKAVTGQVGTNQSESESKLLMESKAVAMLVEHPDWTNAQIARAIGCNRTSVYRFKTLKAARNAQMGKTPPKGSKSEYGVEARDDGDEDEY
jgi:hypothetical protein